MYGRKLWWIREDSKGSMQQPGACTGSVSTGTPGVMLMSMACPTARNHV